MTGSAPGRLCPKAVQMPVVNIPLPCTCIRQPVRRFWTHLHSHLSVINEYFPRKEIGTDRCLVARAELLVDLLGTTVSVSLSHLRYGLGSCRRQSCSADVPMERSYILVHQTRLADTAIPEDDNLNSKALLETSSPASLRSVAGHYTFKRTFFLELMLGGCAVVVAGGGRTEEDENG